jgi:hypothetical protein
MKISGNRKLRRYLFVWGVISVLSGGCLLMTIQPNYASEAKESNVNRASISKIEPPAIPAIDEEAPSMIETASFGLG